MNNYPYNERHYRRFKNLLISLNYDLFCISSFMDEHDKNTDLDDICYYVMALEDRRFFRHCGFDFLSLVREGLRAVRGRKHGGASTIDMQLVRTITGFKDITLFRKLYEIILAILINFKFSKKQIIKCYLRNAFFGSRVIGIERAAEVVYGKRVAFLNDEENAFIAAMLLQPRPLNPKDTWYQSVSRRAVYAQRTRIFVKKSLY